MGWDTGMDVGFWEKITLGIIDPIKNNILITFNFNFCTSPKLNSIDSRSYTSKKRGGRDHFYALNCMIVLTGINKIGLNGFFHIPGKRLQITYVLI